MGMLGNGETSHGAGVGGLDDEEANRRARLGGFDAGILSEPCLLIRSRSSDPERQPRQLGPELRLSRERLRTLHMARPVSMHPPSTSTR
jgi:hypothetical protein